MFEALLWKKTVFSSATDRQKLLYLNLLTSHHVWHGDRTAWFQLPLKYLANDLNWSEKKVAEVCAELVELGAIQWDEPDYAFFLADAFFGAVFPDTEPETNEKPGPTEGKELALLPAIEKPTDLLSVDDPEKVNEEPKATTVSDLFSHVYDLTKGRGGDDVVEFPLGIWCLQKFRELGQSEKCLVFYLMTTPHLTNEQRESGGPYNLPKQYVEADLMWPGHQVLSVVGQSCGLFTFNDDRQEFSIDFGALLPDKPEDEAA